MLWSCAYLFDAQYVWTGVSAAVLRCGRFCLTIHEQFRRCNMSLPGGLFPLRARFLRPPRTFSHRLQTDLLGQVKQDGRQVCRAHRIKHVPLRSRNRDHHPVIGRRNFVGDRVQRHLFIHRLVAMHPTQRRQHHRQDVVRHQRQAKAE